MKKKIYMILGILLTLLACLSLFAFFTEVGSISAQVKEATAQGEATTSIYLGAVIDVLTALAIIVAAVLCFVKAFEDGEVGYVIEEDEPDEDEYEDEESEEPEEQIARMEEQKRLAEEARMAPKAMPKKFVKSKKDKKGKNAEQEQVAPEPVQEPCLQCKTCVHRLGDINHCRVYENKPSYIKNNRFECNEYRAK